MPNSLQSIKSPASSDKSRRPKYRRVCDHLYEEVRAGRLVPGQALPSEPALSEHLGISRNTLRQALAMLEDEGMIRRVHGRGTFLTSEQQRQARLKRDAFAFIAPQICEDIYPPLIQGFENGCSSFQHQTVVCTSSNDVCRQADLLMQLIYQEVGGVALVPATTPPTPPHQLLVLQKNHIPIVCCHRTVAGVTTPSVVISGVEDGRKAAGAFLARGHRRIAFLFAHRYSMADERAAGMRAAIQSHAESAVCDLQLAEYGTSTSPSELGARELIGVALNQLLTKPNRPTAICAHGPREAEQVYLQAKEFGLEVPRDLSLIYFGSTWREGALAQRISSVDIDEQELGARAAQLLHEMRTGNRAIDNNEQIVFPSSLFLGETLGEVPSLAR